MRRLIVAALLSLAVLCAAPAAAQAESRMAGTPPVAGIKGKKLEIKRGKLYKEGVHFLQEFLYSQGHYPEPPDGIWGPKTTKAIKSYQTLHGLAVTGTLNHETKSSMQFNGLKCCELDFDFCQCGSFPIFKF